MIRVLHSVSNMDRGGIETMLMNYYRHIDRTKVQFDFLCNKSKIGAYEEEIKSMGGRIFRTPGLNPLKYFDYMQYMKNLFREHPEYKIVHAHNGALGVYALHCAKLNKIPVRIFHAHSASIGKDLKLPLKLFCKSRLKSNINEQWGCGNESLKFYFGNSEFEKGNCYLIKNAIELEKFIFNESVRNGIKKEYDLENNFVIGHVGRFRVEKNHKFLMEIFAELVKQCDNAKLVLLGDGELQAQVEEYSKQLGIYEKVLFVGNVQNVNEWYQAFDVFLLPSFREGLPVVGVEAQSADLPCIFSDGVPEDVAITENAQFLTLESGVQAWVNAIIKLKDKGDRTDKSEAIRNAGYNIYDEAKKLENKYIELIEGLSL